MEAARDEAWGLVGSWGRGEGATLVLNGHVDVVPPGGAGWTADPWAGEVRDGRVLGRGACDMKAGLVCQLLAVRALRDAGVGLHGRVLLQSVVGEEDGGLGTFATLGRGHVGDLAVICEPTRGQIVSATAGALTFRLVVPGRSVHASARLEGVDAIDNYLQRARRAAPARAGAQRRPSPADGRLPAAVPDLGRHPDRGQLGQQRPRPGWWPRAGSASRSARASRTPAPRSRTRWSPTLRRGPVAAPHPAHVEWWGGQFAPGEVEPGAAVTRLVAGRTRRCTAGARRCSARRTARTSAC